MTLQRAKIKEGETTRGLRECVRGLVIYYSGFNNTLIRFAINCILRGKYTLPNAPAGDRVGIAGVVSGPDANDGNARRDHKRRSNQEGCGREVNPSSHLCCCINSRLKCGRVVSNPISYCIERRLCNDEKTTATPAVSWLAAFAFWSCLER